MVDQGLSSLTNLIISLAVARIVAPVEFGLFSAFFLLYVLALGTARAVTSEPFVVRFGTGRARRRRAAAAEATGAALVLGATVSGALLVVALWLPATPRLLAFAMAFVLPGLLLQDVLRFVALSNGRPKLAVANDGVWLGWVIAVIALTSSSWGGRTWLAMLAWGAGANIAALLAAWHLRLCPRPGRWRSWLAAHRDLGPRYLAEFLAVQASGQVTVYLVGVSAGLRELAALRGGQVLFGPFHVFDAGTRQLGISQLGALHDTDPVRFRRMLVLVSVMLVAVAASLGVAVLTLPDPWGRALLGRTWNSAQPVILPLTIQKSALALSAGAFCGLRVLEASRLGLRARGTMALLTAACGYVGAITHGAVGAALGMAGGQLLGAGAYVCAFRQAERDHIQRPRDPEPDRELTASSLAEIAR